MLGVQSYGGGLWDTWFDRPLTAAGRVFIKNDDNTICEKLLNIEKPIACIPHLAIHLEHEYAKKFEYNKENHWF